MNFTILLLGLLIALPGMANAYNILIIMAFGSKSHKNALDPIAAELGKRGHQVTLMSSVNDKQPVQGVKSVYLPLVAEAIGNVSFFEARTNQGAFFKKVLNVVFDTCNATYREPAIQELIKNPTGYDVLIVDGGFNDFMLPLAHHMRIPLIYVMPAELFPPIAWNLNIPHPYSYIPSKGSTYTSAMPFHGRAMTAVINVLFIAVRNHLIFPWLDRFITENVLPDSPPILELERNVSFVLANSHPAVNNIMPSMPYFVEVGCLHCTPAKALPKELDDFFNSSGHHGVIYFSVGSVTKGDDMPLDLREKLIKAFGQLPQKILWKYESPIENLPANIKLIKWAPQQDILGHPQLRLFISHSGGLSTMEAAYHGCPVLGFPLSGEQQGNCAKAKHLSFAECLDWGAFTYEELLNQLQQMLADKRYKQKATELSVLLRDEPWPPTERAAHWIEYVIRHKGAPHLKSSAGNLNFLQYFLIDVVVVLLTVSISLMVILYLIVKNTAKFICKKVRGRKTQSNIKLDQVTLKKSN